MIKKSTFLSRVTWRMNNFFFFTDVTKTQDTDKALDPTVLASLLSEDS